MLVCVVMFVCCDVGSPFCLFDRLCVCLCACLCDCLFVCVVVRVLVCLMACSFIGLIELFIY